LEKIVGLIQGTVTLGNSNGVKAGNTRFGQVRVLSARPISFVIALAENAQSSFLDGNSSSGRLA
jgi:hypothetical protein